MAKVNVRIGAMESIKSTEALAIYHNYMTKGHTPILAKPSIDTKADDSVVSRMGVSRETDFTFTPEEDVRRKLIAHAAAQKIVSVHVFIVDEANFITPDQAKQLHALTVSDNEGLGEVPVIAFGLRTTAMGEPFMGMATLLAYAKDIEIKDTICRCATKARHNTRKVGGEFTFAGAEVAIDGGDGGAISYESLCSDCYKKEVERALSEGREVQPSVLQVLGIDR